MNQLTLPRLARMRRDAGEVGAEAAIPVATAPHTTMAAAHLADDRHREPTFDDLIAGNDREPSHEDLLANDEFPDATRDQFTSAYPGVAADAIAWLRSQDTEPTPPAAAPAIEPQPAPVDDVPPMPAGNPRLLFDALDALDRLLLLRGLDHDGGSYQLATNAAAVLAYAALRPDLLGRDDVAMMLAPAIAELAEETEPPTDWEQQLHALPLPVPDPIPQDTPDEIETLLNDGIQEWLDNEDGDENHYTRAQLNGEACTVCGVELAEGQPTVPSGYDVAEGQLFAHAACLESEA